MKNSNDTIWDRTSDFRFVAQHLNHCATATKLVWENYIKMDTKDIDSKWNGHSGLEQGLLVEFCRQDNELLYPIYLCTRKLTKN